METRLPLPNECSVLSPFPGCSGSRTVAAQREILCNEGRGTRLRALASQMSHTDVSCAHMFNGPPGQARCQHTPLPASRDGAYLQPLPRTSKPHAHMHMQQSTSARASPTVPTFSKYPRSRWALLRFTRGRVRAHLQGTPQPYLPEVRSPAAHTHTLSGTGPRSLSQDSTPLSVPAYVRFP